MLCGAILRVGFVALSFATNDERTHAVIPTGEREAQAHEVEEYPRTSAAALPPQLSYLYSTPVLEKERFMDTEYGDCR
jgi:hypothetical protein